ncbi:MAG: ABC transporter substrate-binding protein [Candidatus Hermodarchaeota archaeon]
MKISDKIPNEKKKFLKIRRLRAQKKSLLIGGIIGVITIAGIIAGVYYFSVDLYPSHDYIVPGGPPTVPSNRIIKIGVLDDLNHFTGDHAWKGAYLAAKEVNEEGGIIINGNNYYVGLVAENTNEVYGTVLEGNASAKKIIKEHHPHFITGGYSEFLYNYLDVIMEEKIPFLGTGAAGWNFCQKVLDNYEKYKYFFRISPNNIACIYSDYLSYIVYLYYYLNSIDAGIVNKTAILRDDNIISTFCANLIYQEFPKSNISVVVDEILPYNVTEADFINFWNQIESKGVQVVCSTFFINPLFGKLMSQTYQQLQPKCLIVSLSSFGQLNTDWDYDEGACQYEILLQGTYNTSKTPLTIPFFNRYVNEYGIDPYYIGVGSYGAVKLLVQTVNETQTFDPDITVSTLEKINSTNYVVGPGGNLAFDNKHDLVYGWPYSYALFCQWKYIDGSREVVPHESIVPFEEGMVGYKGYPEEIATGSLRLPYWGINGLLTDPPQPPGNFTMNSTAETPYDYDGEFNLTWTNSTGADNYSIYMSDSPIKYISKKFDLLAYQNATSPFSMSLKKGEYYFRVVAYNETGETMSYSYNDIYVSIPGPEPFDLRDNTVGTDTDGTFDLDWDESERADNYSVYHYKSKITSINGSLTCLANLTTETSFHVTGLSTGRYYFAVAAYNEMGYTLSNNRDIVVRLPMDIKLIIIISAITISSVVGVSSIVLIRNYLKREKKLEKVDKKHKLKK